MRCGASLASGQLEHRALDVRWPQQRASLSSSSSTTPSFLSLSVSVFYVCLCVRQLRAYIDCRHITPGTWLAIDLKGWWLTGS